MRVRTKEEDSPLAATKLLKIPFLIDVEELDRMLSLDDTLLISPCSGVVEIGKEWVTKKDYLNSFSSYIRAIQQGDIDEALRKLPHLTAYLTIDPASLYLLQTTVNKGVVRPYYPTVVLQPHYFSYSHYDQKFRSQVFGTGSISWGLILSFPQLIGDPETKEIKKSDDYPNGHLFEKLQKWIRSETKPTPFLIEGKKMVAPIRLGKNCFSWINSHPQLKPMGLEVA